MDAALKLLADASLEAAEAEEAADAAAWTTASERLDGARIALQALRDAWPAMLSPHRAVAGPAARQVRERLDAVERRLPRRIALVEVPGESDPEEETEPA